jgi:putative zincin peptidase
MTTQAPPPLAGYQPPYRFEYPKIKLQLVGLALLLLVVPPLVWLTWQVQNLPDQGSVVIMPLDLALLLIAVPLTIVIHELIHGLAFRALGYQVTYGVAWHLGAAYAGAFGQFQQRRHMFVVALAPLFVLTAGLLPLLAFPSRAVVIGAFMGLVLNIGGAVGDLYLVWRLLRLPRGALLYDVDTNNMFILEPAAART